MINKLRLSFANRGVAATLQLGSSKIFGMLAPSYWRAKRAAKRNDHEFDRVHGVDTGGTFTPGNNDVSGPNWLHGVKYQAIDPDDFLRVVGTLNIRHEDFTFVDFGSGKGRAVLLATRFPFKKIIGVEYSRHLNEIAQQNLARWQKNTHAGANVEFIWTDACAFPIPDGPLILYFYNPFEKVVMEKLLENLERYFREQPRRIMVVYFCARQAELFDRVSFLKRSQVSGWSTIFDSTLENISEKSSLKPC